MKVSEVLDSVLEQLKGIEMTVHLLKARIAYMDVYSRLSECSEAEQREKLKKYMETYKNRPRLKQ